jgi:surface carbohydrate biosynthesis protein
MSGAAVKVNVLFPVETINRELDARLLVAGHYASPSNRIFIGQHDALFRMVVKTGMRGGLYVGKNLFRALPIMRDYRRYQAIKQHDFALVHIHEEGGIFEGDEDRWRQTLLEDSFDPRCLEPEDYVCTWGDFQRDFYRSLDPKCAEHIITTGHPRFDILKRPYRRYFEPDAAQIIERFGEFILINTNFSLANNGLGLAYSFSKGAGFDPESLDRRVATFGRFAYEMALTGDFVKLANRLSLTFPHLNIVLRPHPAEDWQYYRTVFKDLHNVHVVHEGPVTPWLLACKMVIHNNCTTGMEAHLLDTHVISYKPVMDPKRNMLFASLFGAECFTEDEVVRRAGRILGTADQPILAARLDAKAHSLMANFERDSMAGFLCVLREVEARQSRVTQDWSPVAIKRSEASRAIFERAKSLVRPLFPAKQRQYQTLRSHFPPLDYQVVERKVKRIESMLAKRFDLTFYSSDVFSIEIAS